MRRMTERFVLMLACAGGLAAGTLDWQGVSWDDTSYPPSSLAVDGAGDLVVTPPVGDYGAAHYNTPDLFRAALAPWVQVTFQDPGSGNRGQLWLEDEGSGGAWTQFGAWNTYANYQIWWWDYDTNLDGWRDTGIARTAGNHTFKIGMQSSGAVDYYLDGAPVWSTTDITPAKFGDVYLAAMADSAVFVDYSAGTDYAPTPEPASLTLIGLGAVGIAWAGRRRRAR